MHYLKSKHARTANFTPKWQLQLLYSSIPRTRQTIPVTEGKKTLFFNSRNSLCLTVPWTKQQAKNNSCTKSAGLEMPHTLVKTKREGQIKAVDSVRTEHAMEGYCTNPHTGFSCSKDFTQMLWLQDVHKNFSERTMYTLALNYRNVCLLSAYR